MREEQLAFAATPRKGNIGREKESGKNKTSCHPTRSTPVRPFTDTHLCYLISKPTLSLATLQRPSLQVAIRSKGRISTMSLSIPRLTTRSVARTIRPFFTPPTNQTSSRLLLNNTPLRSFAFYRRSVREEDVPVARTLRSHASHSSATSLDNKSRTSGCSCATDSARTSTRMSLRGWRRG